MNQRPVVRYHGGKWRLAPFIIANMPVHEIYVEPFGGAGSVLLRKIRSRVEVFNDLNGEMVNVFRIIRDPLRSIRLAELLRATPCSYAEFIDSQKPSPDPIEQARRTIVRGHQSHGSTGVTGGKKTGWRRGVRMGGQASSNEWAAIWKHVEWWCDRLRGVFIEQESAIAVIKRWDEPNVLHYIDPPYLAETRSSGNGAQGYAHEMTTADHIALAEILHQVKGKVMISGYPSELYRDLYLGWRSILKSAQADAGASRTEVLWLNASASGDLDLNQKTALTGLAS